MNKKKSYFLKLICLFLFVGFIWFLANSVAADGTHSQKSSSTQVQSVDHPHSQTSGSGEKQHQGEEHGERFQTQL